MTLFGRIVLLCLIVSALQGLVAVFAIAIVLLLLWGLFYRTEQTIGLIALYFRGPVKLE